MHDDRTIRLLEEIRDLQRQHAEIYKEAVRNQQDAILFQRRVTKRMTMLVVPLIVVVLILIAWVMSVIVRA